MKKNNSILEIDLETVSQNVEILKSYCNQSVKTLAVVKADAYGHGAVEVVQKIGAQVDWLAVNNVQEAVELREHDVSHPILVFEPPNSKTAAIYQAYNLTATVSEEAHFDLLKQGTEYHLLFDTGMGRLGFSPALVQKVRKLKESHADITCTGIYSHFANADALQSPTLNRQYKLFDKICESFKDELITHICNTGGIAQLPEAHCDMVRAGIGIYGYGPGQVEIEGLQPLMQWKTSLVQVKPIKKGDRVSYGSTWECPKDGYLGVLPVGFEDGLPRRLSGHLQVKIDGKYYSTAGIITMNYTMVYLKNNQLETGTEVLLLGDESSAGSWAHQLGTIPYEIMVSISPKIPRLYINS